METNLSNEEGNDTDGEIIVDTDATEGKDITRRKPAPQASRKAPSKPTDEQFIEWEQRSKRVVKRITNMQRAFEQQRADDQAEHQRQLALRDDRIARLEKGGDTATVDEAAHQKAMDALEKQIVEAQERGDSVAVAKLNREMATLEGKYWAAQTAKQLNAGGAGVAKPNNGAQPNGAAPRKPTKAGVAFAAAQPWWNDPDEDAVEAKEYANYLHTKRLKQGDGDPESPEYFEEIRKKVQARFPEVETVSLIKNRPGDDPDDEDEDDPKPVRRAAPASFQNRGEPSTRQRRNTLVLTNAEQRNMRNVGLDPDNDKHVREYVRSLNEGVSS